MNNIAGIALQQLNILENSEKELLNKLFFPLCFYSMYTFDCYYYFKQFSDPPYHSIRKA